LHNLLINTALAVRGGWLMKIPSWLAVGAIVVTAFATLAVSRPAAADHRADAATNAAAAGTGRVRVVHMSPDAPPVDILVDGAAAAAGLTFKEASPYATLPAGTYGVAVTPAGLNDAVVLGAELPVAEQVDATVVAIGTLDALELLVLVDDNAVPSAGNAKVRFVHTSPDAPAVDIAVAGGPVLFPDVAFKQFAGYAELPPGAYDLEVRVAGTTTVALSLPGVTLTDGQIVTIFAAGLLGDGSLTAVPVAYPTAPSIAE